MDIDFDADYQDDIVRVVKKLSELIIKEILNYHKQKNFFVEGKLMIMAKPELTGEDYNAKILG